MLELEGQPLDEAAALAGRGKVDQVVYGEVEFFDPGVHRLPQPVHVLAERRRYGLGVEEQVDAALSDLENARAGFESAEAAVQSLQNQVSLAVQQLGYARLTAPVGLPIGSDTPEEIAVSVAAQVLELRS